MNSKLYNLMLMYGMAGLFANPNGGYALADNKQYQDLTEEERLNLEKYYKEQRNKLLLKKGLKEFKYNNDVIVIALNKKNADKKYIKYIKNVAK